MCNEALTATTNTTNPQKLINLYKNFVCYVLIICKFSDDLKHKTYSVFVVSPVLCVHCLTEIFEFVPSPVTRYICTNTTTSKHC